MFNKILGDGRNFLGDGHNVLSDASVLELHKCECTDTVLDQEWRSLAPVTSCERQLSALALPLGLVFLRILW